ncbi:MAG: hypothetical protein KIS90_09605 [Phenylobacterium sp.]|uniref:hypothetical protein n=1 Tax=Phenylobacterium sp. SCN 70-31 TaxID=1660129 RepID=UPI00086A27F5|nr:hypothetical protein [Phenylobacterium sp. SCN 70-31]MCW5760010.1 hypothetical protein [Phenylobacterium sp.]ODT87667.1 MAG: hypothetical protein ABS78_11000 [Phenylobacterium sp. SCN 70-31]
MNTRIFGRVTLAAAAAQVGMVVAGHYSAPIRDNLFALGGMGISMLAGLFYARIRGGGWADSLVGGLLSGGACAFLGIGVSVFLGDVPISLLAFGTAGSAIAGLIGGAAGRLTAPRPGP